MKKFIYILAVSMLGMMGCSEDTITYINPTPGEEPSEVIAELGISSKNTWFIPADGLNAAIGFKSLGGEVVVDIQTNVAWKYTATGAEWLTIEKDDVADQLILSCESNKVEEKQNSTVTVTAGDKTATITVSQNAYGTLEISASENNFQIPARGELTASFEVLSTEELGLRNKGLPVAARRTRRQERYGYARPQRRNRRQGDYLRADCRQGGGKPGL